VRGRLANVAEWKGEAQGADWQHVADSDLAFLCVNSALGEKANTYDSEGHVIVGKRGSRTCIG